MSDFLSITFLSYNDNPLLFSTFKQFIENTNFKNIISTTVINILVQSCSKSYVKTIENICVLYNKDPSYNIKCVLHTEENMGVSKANNYLYNLTKHFKYVLHIEDDWIIHPSKIITKDWLKLCIHFLENNEDVSTIALRAYGNSDEEYRYGWSRTIPYLCHEHKDNFNYKDKLINTKLLFSNEEELGAIRMIEIKNFLFTFNPVIRRNKDYIEKNVYPLPEYNDKDEIIEFKDDSLYEKKHENDRWGWCEANTMEKIRDLRTYMYENGIFYHFDDNIQLCKDNELSIFKNDFTGFFNINCHYPVLVIHINNILKDVEKCKHEFLSFIHYHWDINLDKEKHIKKLERILIDIKPRGIITVGNIYEAGVGTILSNYFTFEHRRSWIHLKDIKDINITHVEYCIFNGYKNEGKKYSPLISVITPAYESKHRIYRPYKSLLNQTYNNWEWIIIDDSKTENTWKTLIELAESDHRIKIFKRHKNNGSIGENKLFCASVSKGDFIFELDHDDDILPETFDRLINASRKYPDAGFFYSDCVELIEDSLEPFRYGEYFGLGFGSYYKQWHNNDFHNIYKTHRVNPVVQRHIVGVPNHFRCWTKKAYLDVGGHMDTLQVADDYDLIVRTMNKYRWCHIPELLYLQYRNNGGDNFTFHRNALIQYLVNQIRYLHEKDIHNRFLELKVDDDFHNKLPTSKLDYEINYFQYPILDYLYVHNDQDENNPLISIVIPTYNRKDYLKKALDSVFKQTYTNFEILLVGDKCPELDDFVKNYDNAKDKRFKFINLYKNYGSGGAVPRNYAIKKMCNSNWFCYLDDDNELLENHLQTFVDEIRKDKEVTYIVNSMIIDGKELYLNELRKGRIDTTGVCQKFDLSVKYGLWKDRNEAGYAHDFEYFSRWKDEKGIFTNKATYIYNNEFNGQTYQTIMSL